MNRQAPWLLHRQQLVHLVRATFCAFTLCAAATAALSQEVCFALDTDPGPTLEREGCQRDPLRLEHLPEVENAVAGLAIPAARIALWGCRKTKFETAAPVSASSSTGQYKIYYPLLERPTHDYVAPIIHELGHVYQLQSVGSPHALLQKYSRLQIELGADYLTGVVARHYLSGIKPEIFQGNLEIVGLYRELAVEAHGTPNQRNEAFRRGFFLRQTDFQDSIVRAYQEYDDEAFPFVASHP